MVSLLGHLAGDEGPQESYKKEILQEETGQLLCLLAPLPASLVVDGGTPQSQQNVFIQALESDHCKTIRFNIPLLIPCSSFILERTQPLLFAL